jgi:hypothetical protein
MGSLTATIDEKQYGRLLARTVPRVIKTKAENERALAIVESLMEKGERNMTIEESELLDLLTNLIRDYEATAYPPREKSKPHEMVAFLLIWGDLVNGQVDPGWIMVWQKLNLVGGRQSWRQDKRQMRRLITLISAGRNRTIVIRRELPRTRDAGWVGRPYRIEDWRILLSVSPCPITSTDVLRTGV